MKESSPYETPRNSSIHHVEGELDPQYSWESMGFNRYVDKDNHSYYRIFDSPKEQFVISQLASLIIPVANVFIKHMPHEGPVYFSPDVKEHPNHDIHHQEISLVDQSLLELLFRDTDHDTMRNHDGSVMYDFDVGDIDITLQEESIIELADDVYDMFQRYGTQQQVQKLILKLKTFKTHIEGESGLAFITALVHKANYTYTTPEKIQQTLLSRCGLSLTTLEK